MKCPQLKSKIIRVDRFKTPAKKKMDATGIEPMTSSLQGKRATNCATCPYFISNKITAVNQNASHIEYIL